MYCTSQSSIFYPIFTAPNNKNSNTENIRITSQKPNLTSWAKGHTGRTPSEATHLRRHHLLLESLPARGRALLQADA